MVQQHLTFTVFTPTYNRADTLYRVYDSLCQQTFRDFEWLIVDDGSEDTTQNIVSQWQADAKFPIHYYWQANQGKAVAANYAAQKANGALFLPLDSDDACVPTALERLYFHWQSIPRAERQKFSAVTCLCMDENGQLVGTRFPRDIIDSNSAEIRYRYHVRGEKWGFQRTDMLREYRFPTDTAVNHIPEGILWNAIAKKYRTRFVNEILRIYYQKHYNNTRHRRQSIASTAMKQPYGLAVWHRTILNDDWSWFRYAPLEFVRSAVHFARFSLNHGVRIAAQHSELTNWLAKALWLIMLPVGFLMHYRDRSRSPRCPKRISDG